MSAKPDFLIVLSLERTASTSVFRALRRAAPGTPVIHVHFLDGDAYRQAPTDAAADRMHPDALKAVARRIDLLLDKELSYDRNVYQALGLPARPAPGAHSTNSGARLFALDFRRIGQDFETATESLFGQPVALLHENAGAGIGDPRGYAAFRRLCAETLLPERLGLVS